MKYIFDFDDVLFNNTKQFKKHMYSCLEQAGVSQEIVLGHYNEMRENEFSLKKFISILLVREKISRINSEDVYEKIMSECPNFVNKKLIEMVKEAGKDNCFIVTNGEEQFQKDKINKSGITPLFSEIYIVPGSKKEIIYKICEIYKNEKITFFEDKIKFIEDIDLAKCPNLKTNLYDEASLDAKPV